MRTRTTEQNNQAHEREGALPPLERAARRSALQFQRVFAGEIGLAGRAERSGGDHPVLGEDDVFPAFVAPDDLPRGGGGDGVGFTEAFQHIADGHRKGDFMRGDGAFAFGFLGGGGAAVRPAEDVGEHEHRQKNGQVFHAPPMTTSPIREVKRYRVNRGICCG